MAWFVLARCLFVAAVAFAAAILQPLPISLIANVSFALALAGLVVVFEFCLRATAISRVLGALIGCGIGLAIATHRHRALLGEQRRPKSRVLHTSPDRAAYLGPGSGRQAREWLEPARMSVVPATAPQRRYKIIDTSVIIDGRIADVCETGSSTASWSSRIRAQELQLPPIRPIREAQPRPRASNLRRFRRCPRRVSIYDLDFPEVREVDLK